MKIICNNCRFLKFNDSLVNFYGPIQQECHHPSNVSEISGKEIPGNPEKINKNNDCKYFKLRHPGSARRSLFIRTLNDCEIFDSFAMKDMD